MRLTEIEPGRQQRIGKAVVYHKSHVGRMAALGEPGKAERILLTEMTIFLRIVFDLCFNDVTSLFEDDDVERPNCLVFSAAE